MFVSILKHPTFSVGGASVVFTQLAVETKMAVSVTGPASK